MDAIECERPAFGKMGYGYSSAILNPSRNWFNLIWFDLISDLWMFIGLICCRCKHYRRRCKIRAPCCNEIYDCRHCHNEATVPNMLSFVRFTRLSCVKIGFCWCLIFMCLVQNSLPNLRDHHDLVRHDVEHVCSYFRIFLFSADLRLLIHWLGFWRYGRNRNVMNCYLWSLQVVCSVCDTEQLVRWAAS